MTTENERPLDTFGLTNYNDTSDRGTLVPPVDLNNVDTNTNERPLDNFNLYNYDESTDRGVLTPNKEDQATQLENNIENGNITPEQLPENSPIQQEAEQLTDSNPHNDEVKDEAVEDFIKQIETAQPSKQEQDEAAYRQQLNDMQLADDINSNIDNYDMLHFTPEEDKPTEFMWAPGSFMRKDIGDEVNVINSYPTSQKRAALELLARIKSGDIDSYEDMLKANPWMDEAMYDAISSIASNDNSGRIPVITKSSLKRNKAKLENFIEKHPEEADATLSEGPAKEEAEQILYDDDKRNDEVNDEAVGEFLNSNLPALNLQDYHKDVALDGGRELDTTETDDVDYRVVEDSDFVPPTYTIDDLDREIEEVSKWPVTNAEEAKEKQNKLKKLKARRVAYGGASTSNTNWDYDKSGATGGKVSPRAGIGSIGGAAGHGSMASTSPTKVSDNHNSIASKAPLPQALEDNQGRVVSVNGKATTAPNSNNNGAFRSGSFGLMSKASSNLKSIKSKAPVSGGAKHTGSSMSSTGIPNIDLDDGKQALIERLKMLLAQLTDEEKKELGFSSELNQWNGTSLNKLDGYTLQDLIDKVEEQLGENE